MNRLLVPLLVPILFSVLSPWAMRAAELGAGPAADAAAHVTDPAKMLPANPPAAAALEEKLAAFERASGVRILVRFQAKSPTPEEDKVPGAYMHALATRLGTAGRGALAVYFADEDDWRVWIGDDSTTAFVGRAGTAKEFTESGAMHEAKEAFLKKTRDAGDAAFAAQQKNAPAVPPPPSPGRLSFEAGALLDGLVGKLGPK